MIIQVVANPAPDSETYLSVGFRMKDSKAGFQDGTDGMIITQTKFGIKTSTEKNEQFDVKEDGQAYTSQTFKYPG